MATKVRVVLDLDQLRSLTYEQPMSSMLWGKAQAVMNAARAVAPVQTGRYASSFALAFAKTDRNVARVHNNAPWALSVEYGGSDTAKSRPLGRGLDAAGLQDIRLTGSLRDAKAKRTRAVTKKTKTSARHRNRVKRLKKKYGSA
jgi:hypothetical protein